MISTITMHKMRSARILGHLLFQAGVLPLDAPFSEGNSGDEAVAWASVSSSSPLSVDLTSKGVCSVALVDSLERADREERVDWDDF